ncbi:hypothetical protein GCM10027075_74560 [Streptomyces heilongjiangensis]|uniref:DUF7196 family protein n=1 Tax=Streptomyces sp. HM190 TaxID=2695266 RepID=UPI0019179351|nr:hypothetical protein [Streptomyces sp. HM190]
MAPCNCGRVGRSEIVYRLVLPNGVTRDYPTRREADAANNRAGGRGSITAIRR